MEVAWSIMSRLPLQGSSGIEQEYSAGGLTQYKSIYM